MVWGLRMWNKTHTCCYKKKEKKLCNEGFMNNVWLVSGSQILIHLVCVDSNGTNKTRLQCLKFVSIFVQQKTLAQLFQLWRCRDQVIRIQKVITRIILLNCIMIINVINASYRTHTLASILKQQTLQSWVTEPMVCNITSCNSYSHFAAFTSHLPGRQGPGICMTGRQLVVIVAYDFLVLGTWAHVKWTASFVIFPDVNMDPANERCGIIYLHSIYMLYIYTYNIYIYYMYYI